MADPLTATLATWAQVADTFDDLAVRGWVFRGHASAAWVLETSLEREFGIAQGHKVEQELLWKFVRTAPRWLQSHLVPSNDDAASWLGLVQHYGGPTRLLDVTRSPYAALFFAFESVGDENRAVWAIDHVWCTAACARLMANAEGKPVADVIGRTAAAQAQLVYSLVHRQPFRDPLFEGFQPFTGVFPVDPFKPDARQIAQQAMFLCSANPARAFMDNLAANPRGTPDPVSVRYVIPAAMRPEILERLATMNVSAATLFPDLSGLARSLRTLPVRRPR